MRTPPTYSPGANRHQLAQGHCSLITAIFTLLEIVLVGLVIAACFIAVMISGHFVSSSPASRFDTSDNSHARDDLQM